MSRILEAMQAPLVEHHQTDAMAQHYREKGRTDILDLLLMTDCRSFLLFLARTGRSEVLRSLLKRHKASPDSALRPNDLDSAFLAAAREAKPQCLHVMMDELDPEACDRLLMHAKSDDKHQRSALMLAAEHKHADNLRQLL
jgi:hypothetical protein